VITFVQYTSFTGLLDEGGVGVALLVGLLAAPVLRAVLHNADPYDSYNKK